MAIISYQVIDKLSLAVTAYFGHLFSRRNLLHLLTPVADFYELHS